MRAIMMAIAHWEIIAAAGAPYINQHSPIAVAELDDGAHKPVRAQHTDDDAQEPASIAAEAGHPCNDHPGLR